MSNILNHNRDIFQFYLNKEDYWDFHLCVDNISSDYTEGLTERCLSAYIDMSNDECIWFDNVYSKSKYVWENAINNGLIFSNFGFTSVDNGKTCYEKDRITNKEFFQIFTDTKYNIEKNDLRLTLTKVKGNQQLYDYSNDIAFWNDKFQVSKLNGGWYQGFFCGNNGENYKVLPTDIGNGWDLEFVLNKEDFNNEKQTLNDVYPENKGIFFYIGTRAENKWWLKYLTNHNFDWCLKTAFDESYANSEYLQTQGLNDDYFKSIVEMYENIEYFSDEYLLIEKEKFESAFIDEYTSDNKFCEHCQNYVDDEYIEKDLTIDENMTLKTEDGYDINQPNIGKIKTNNKFLIFDRTCEGQTANKWDENNTEIILDYIKKPNIGNYFTLFHRGCDGYDVKKIQKVLDTKNKEYNVLQDLYRNAFALQIKDDGTIGYKYLIKDCDSEEENYQIEHEFTTNSVISNNKWYTIHIKIKPIRYKNKSNLNCLSENTINDKMQIMFYVNGKLVLVSKELPIFNFKMLNDLEEKQEGVPFNLSIGGGTQGLSEVVYLNYMKLPEYVLPLEKEFGGSFIGWLKSFKFYTCQLNYQEIVGNYNFTKVI